MNSKRVCVCVRLSRCLEDVWSLMKSWCFQACGVFARLPLSVNTLNLKRPFAERPNGSPIH